MLNIESTEGAHVSRHLGELTLRGGVGGGWIDTELAFPDVVVPARIEIDHPTRFNEDVVGVIDTILDYLSYLDNAARSTIKAGLRSNQSTPSQLFRSWKNTSAGKSGDTDSFIGHLSPSFVTILPDAGKASLDRFVIEYSTAGVTTNQKVKVHFKEGIGPEL